MGFLVKAKQGLRKIWILKDQMGLICEGRNRRERRAKGEKKRKGRGREEEEKRNQDQANKVWMLGF